MLIKSSGYGFKFHPKYIFTSGFKESVFVSPLNIWHRFRAFIFFYVEIYIINYNFAYSIQLRPAVVQKLWLIRRLVVSSIPTGNKIFICVYISVFLLWCRGKGRHWVLPLNTQCLQSSAKSGERSVLTLGYLCLPCCDAMRDTTWNR